MDFKNNMKLNDHTVMFHSFPSPRPIRTESRENVRGTKCTIKKNGQLVAEAEVSKSYKDEDNKALAREYALRKAIRSIESKEIRTSFWNELNPVENV